MTTTEQERESRITGYGRGWQEQKAKGSIARFLQIMREPATTTIYYVASVIWVAFMAAIILVP